MKTLPELKPDPEAAADFLRRMHRTAGIHLATMKPEGRLIPETLTEDRMDDLENWIRERHLGRNVYYHVNELRRGLLNVKAKKRDISVVVALHVDVDRSDAETLEKIRRFLPPPTAIVFSGGGYQAYWILAVATPDIDWAERCNMMLAAALGGDNCHNADRLLRVPGTVNYPNAKKRAAGRVPTLAYTVESDWSRLYSLADFASLKALPAQAGTVGHLSELVTPVEISALPASINTELRSLIELGDDDKRPRGTEAPRFRSRSEAVFSVACALVKLGCSEEQIAGILINRDLRISESVVEKKARASAYALKQARSALSAVESGWPDVTQSGSPRATMRNAMASLRKLGLICSYDLFRHRLRIDGNALDSHQGEISDNVVIVLRTTIIDTFGFDPRSDHVRDAVNALCLENALHPIREMLDRLRWDGTPRIDSWLPKYMGTGDSAYVRAVSAIILIAAVRRVRQPGVKFDQIVVLEGVQGSGKSTALQILAGPENHSDQEILTAEAKEQMELMEGIWIYELGEIQGLNRAEINKTKAFASRTVDSSRMAYMRFKEGRPRQNIFIGTTNEDTYLRDQTGNRRFWPIKTTTIDLEALRRDRDQLWAEAAAREAQGASITLPEELWAAAASEQADRLEEDPWLEKLAAVRGYADGTVVRIATADLFADVLRIPMERRTQWHHKHVATLMLGLGWKKTKYRRLGADVRGYQRPKPTEHKDDVRIEGDLDSSVSGNR